ncbi:MAG: plastocyanin/azurin family copper-binding protein [Verrucomicrobiota bacterium]|nr:plastocyanin/azurin family copper-binding protein [Verrucomicrobiota bacterium]
MTLRTLLPILGAFAWAASIRAAAPEKLELREGDHICLIGNTLAERMQHHHHWETLLHSRFPKHQLVVRNLSWPADEVVLRPRAAGFGEPEEHLAFSKADVVLAFFGFNESFAGAPGLASFKEDLGKWVAETSKQDFSGKGAPRLALISPIAHEDLGDPHLPNGSANNKNLELYTAAMKEVAQTHAVLFADVFHPTLKLFADPKTAHTINGVHLSEKGDAEFAKILDRALFGEAGAPAKLDAELRRAVADKDFHWYHRYRIVDSFYVYGGRSGLKFADGPQTNRDVMEREREVLDVMCANRDRRIWAIARGEKAPGKVDDSNTPPFLPVTTSFGVNQKTDPSGAKGQSSKTAEGESARILPSEESLKRFKLAPGYAIALFASEEKFPELGNAVATAFDAKGRLWVVTMQSYPQWRPGDKMDDKVLILTDSNGDGKADDRKIFAGGMHLPLGIEFANGGVLVSQQRELLFLKDTDGDDQADLREIVLSGFDSADSHHVINAFTFDPGGALYFQEGTFHHTQVETPYGPVRCKNAGTYRYEPLSQKLDVFVSYSYANPHGQTFDRWGQAFISDSSGGANYFATAFSGWLPYPEKHKTMKQWFPKRVRPTSGCEFVSSRHFPDEAQGNFLLNNTIGVQGVLQHKVREAGSGYEGEEITPLVLSDDPNFRPVDMEFGPDGALYLTDWQDALIGHMQYSIRDPLRDRAHARIWRVTYPARPLLRPAPIAGEPIESLLETLKQPEDRTRLRAKQELSGRPAKEVLVALGKWTAALDPKDASHQHHRAEALWVHQWLNAVNEPLLQQQLRAPDHRARAAATRVLCYWRDRIPDALALLKVQANDEHPLVRLEAVRAASFFKGAPAVEVALEILEHETDDYLTYTLEETMRALSPSPKDITDPRGLTFVLDRLNNAELAQAPRAEAVFAAQVERKGMDLATRETALAELARLHGTTREAEIVAALMRMDERFKDTGAADELGRILASASPAELAKARAGITRLATKDHSLPQVRRAGLAALVVADSTPATAWKMTEESTDSRAMLLESISLIGDPAIRARFQPLVAPLLTKTPRLAENVRTAALRALPLLGPENAVTNFSILATRLRAGQDRPIAARAMLQLPRASWADEDAAALADSILAYAQTVPAEKRTAQNFIETVQLGTELASHLPPAEGGRIRKALRELGVSVFVVKAVREQMRYDTTRLVVEAGKPFEVIFENVDIMPHNFVVILPNSRQEVGMAAATMPATPDKAGRLYVPESNKVLAASKMLEPAEKEKLTITAPKEPGDYEYVCTFPGHWPVMWGKLVVTKDVETYLQANPQPATPEGTAAAVHAHP